ncbi:hypothetical protein [Candidatus Poriferisocius sp.]|uniref:hypothetical protein n=1 Tax=Candidatus Poriferisocius sp. TaxID=3101276 RepID=UPI003B02D6E2
MTIGVVLGTMIGIGFTIAFWGLFPPRAPLQNRLMKLNQLTENKFQTKTLQDSVGEIMGQCFKHFGLHKHKIEHDLKITNQSLEKLAIVKLETLIFGAGLPVLIWLLAWLNQIWISPVFVMSMSILIGGLLFLLPDLLLQRKARNYRQELRHQLSTYLDLVGLHLAGGSGIEKALTDSVAYGKAWGFVKIEQALRQAQRANEPLWISLEKLGRDLGSADLEELGTWFLLAGTSGSQVRSSLHTKAKGLRERALNEAETEAQRATERMSLPIVLLFTAFLGLISYPAFAAIIGQ